ncbi:hypothetical protein Leryth_011745 [Lithospermum erythrorhizon]|nr:hypothetical protein Leryth_011745 [Lithospermum erythrorhizon]
MQQPSCFDQTTTSSSTSETLTNSLFFNLSILKDRINQIQSLVTIFIGPDHDGQRNSESTTAIVIPTMETLIQEIIITASSMLFSCQQISLGSNMHNNSASNDGLNVPSGVNLQENVVPITQAEAPLEWYDRTYKNNENKQSGSFSNLEKRDINDDKGVTFSENISRNYDIVELDAADLLAKYTHYCHVCGKGFKRDANLRMHMRAHGEEYKSTAALCNPLNKKIGIVGEHEKEGYSSSSQNMLPKKYSCPQEGCRWNRKHAKFQPLKSMICVKNHYKRSHCPKMFVCKRCSRKQFSVLSDLRTHEKHCGDLKWQCSCGSTFSRKDKLMGHATLFIGHIPLLNQGMKA